MNTPKEQEILADAMGREQCQEEAALAQEKVATTQPKTPRRIVAEITKNWPLQSNTPIISQQFEHIIAVNAARGYDLESWQLAQIAPMTGPGPVRMIETIIAVFVSR